MQPIALFIFLSTLLITTSPTVLAGGQEPFIKTSFLNLKDDLAEARRANRGLMILYEQEGCPYCAKMHKVHFSDLETIGLIVKNFDVVQLDTLGSRKVMDFDGNSMTEKQLANKLRVQFVPLVGFFGPDGKEVFRFPGYIQQVEMFRAGLRYVIDKQYEQIPFSAYTAKFRSGMSKKGLVDEPFFNREHNLYALLASASKNSKGVALVFEQESCAGCIDLHEKTFNDTSLTDALTKHFEVVRLDIRGGRKLKDFHGKVSTERSIANALSVKHTPSIIFFDQEGKEILRLESYLTPEHFKDLITFATTDARRQYSSFQEWLVRKPQR